MMHLAFSLTIYILCTFTWNMRSLCCCVVNGANSFSHNWEGNYYQRRNLHTLLVYSNCIQIMFECIRSSIIQCVQLISHAIYLIFRCFAQSTINSGPFFFKSSSCSDLIMDVHTTPLKSTHSLRCRCVTSLFCTLLATQRNDLFYPTFVCVWVVVHSMHFCALSFQYFLSNYSGRRCVRVCVCFFFSLCFSVVLCCADVAITIVVVAAAVQTPTMCMEITDCFLNFKLGKRHIKPQH